MTPLNFAGLKITVMPDPAPGRWEPLPWRARLLSWPWRPWVARRWIPGGDRLCPPGEMLRAHGRLFAYRAEYDALHRALDNLPERLRAPWQPLAMTARAARDQNDQSDQDEIDDRECGT